ncbi:MAG: hypothetical protein R3F19_00345 [Verrucomicrobiales bacterium]
MKHDREYLGRDGFLLRHGLIPFDGEERGFFFGAYPRSEFQTLEDFARFTQNISSITQDWYSTGDLDGAYSFYIPDESDKCWIDRVEKQSGLIQQWIHRLGAVGFNFTQVPQWEGTFYAYGDTMEFGIVGETPDEFFDAFIADT